MSDTVSFTQMKDGTKEDYELLEKLEKPFLALTADRVLEELRRQGHVTLEGYRITRLDHGLQSATRAERDGADIDWIVAALLHDIGDGLAPQNHDRMSAEVIRPFVRWDVAWVVEHHGIFQMLLLRASLWLGPQRAGPVPRPSVFRQLRRVLRALGPEEFRPGLRRRCRLRISSRWCARSSDARPTIRTSSVKATSLRSAVEGLGSGLVVSCGSALCPLVRVPTGR
jgi:predicted HD phosphohydrolase